MAYVSDSTARPAPAAAMWPDQSVVVDTSRVAQRGPLLHCITNIVAANFSANALLAIGASPAMVENSAESAEFVASADAVLINLGTMSAERSEAALTTAAAAIRTDTPWVLDPVAVGVLTERTRLAHELLAHRPTVIRGNASEIMSLAGAESTGRGVDSAIDSGDAVAAAVELARAHEGVVAVSGVVDYITDGETTLSVPGGDVLLTRVTATGCVLGAMIAAFTTVSDSPLQATVSASALLAAAGERAGRRNIGPGSFAVALLDELFALSQQAIGAR